MLKRRRNEKNKRKKKGDDGMQAALEKNNVSLKMQLLKARANNILQDTSLRHIPNEHDIQKSSENTKLLHTHQQNTIREEGE